MQIRNLINCLLLLLLSCSTLSVNTIKNNNEFVFREIYSEPRPKEIAILNSSYTSYKPKWWAIGDHLFKITTPDWEIELIAPQYWVENQKEVMRKVEFESIKFLLPNFSPWFNPNPNDFEVWQQKTTSVPYKHLFIGRKKIDNNKIHVFMRKD